MQHRSGAKAVSDSAVTRKHYGEPLWLQAGPSGERTQSADGPDRVSPLPSGDRHDTPVVTLALAYPDGYSKLVVTE